MPHPFLLQVFVVHLVESMPPLLDVPATARCSYAGSRLQAVPTSEPSGGFAVGGPLGEGLRPSDATRLLWSEPSAARRDGALEPVRVARRGPRTRDARRVRAEVPSDGWVRVECDSSGDERPRRPRVSLLLRHAAEGVQLVWHATPQRKVNHKKVS